MRLLLFLLCPPLFAAPFVLDAGSAADTECPAGYYYTVQPADDTTLCFGNPVYRIPVSDGVPYVIKFNFLEPSAAPPARVFSVSVNDIVVLPRVTMPGYLVPFSRSTVAMAADGFLVVKFSTIVRSAVISSIEVTPLFQLFAAAPGFRLVQERCARCHGADLRPGDVAGVGGLDLRTRASMLAGGNRGPALVPGNPEASLLWRFASKPQWPNLTPEQELANETSNEDAVAMPPFHPLPVDQLEVIRQWITDGAYPVIESRP